MSLHPKLLPLRLCTHRKQNQGVALESSPLLHIPSSLPIRSVTKTSCSLFMVYKILPSAPSFSALDYWTVPWHPAPGDAKHISGCATPFASPSVAHLCPPGSLDTLTRHSRPWVIRPGPCSSVTHHHSFPCALPPPWAPAGPVPLIPGPLPAFALRVAGIPTRSLPD